MELNFPLIVLCVSFTVLLIMNVPVAFAIAVSCILTYWAEGLPFATGFQSMIAGMNVFLGLRYGVWSDHEDMAEVLSRAHRMVADGLRKR